MRLLSGLAVGVWAALPSLALADVVTGAVAKELLFAPAAAKVTLAQDSGLPDDQAKVLLMVGASQLYYGAIAFSPDDGLMSAATVAAANFHDVGAARAFALAACDAKKTGETACKIAADIHPDKWTEQALQLSSDATLAFEDAYQVEGERAFAISVRTGVFGIGTGTDAIESALTACKAKSDMADDCVVVILN
jgi:hypothetical protein